MAKHKVQCIPYTDDEIIGIQPYKLERIKRMFSANFIRGFEAAYSAWLNQATVPDEQDTEYQRGIYHWNCYLALMKATELDIQNWNDILSG